MKRVGKMNTKAARQFSTLCLSGALTLGAFGEAQAAGNDAALQALFAQANYWHEKSHDELAMESLQKVLSVDANNAQAGRGPVAGATGESGAQQSRLAGSG